MDAHFLLGCVKVGGCSSLERKQYLNGRYLQHYKLWGELSFLILCL